VPVSTGSSEADIPLEIAVMVIEAVEGGVTCDSMVAMDAVAVTVGVVVGMGIVGGGAMKSLVGAAVSERLAVGVCDVSGVRDALAPLICQGN
jgi:hypothetical protein